MGLWRESLTHERIFGIFIVFTLARIVKEGGFISPHFPVYAIALISVIGGVTITRRWRTVWAWKARLAIYPPLMTVLFVHLRWLSPFINDGKKDALLWELDRIIIGGSLSVRLEPLISPPLTEFLSFCYIFFMLYLVICMVGYLNSDKKVAHSFYSGLFSLYGIGFFGYTLIPAVGPYIVYASSFSVPLKGYFLTDFLTAVYEAGTNYTDIFPSLHCAASAYMLFFDKKWNRSRFFCCVLPCAGIWFSTLYLRYHYFTDVAAGALAAVIAITISRREFESR